MSVVGFDFGTESCIVAVCKRGSKGGPDVVQNEIGNRKTSTMVAFSDNQRLIGDSAVSQLQRNWKNTIHNFKNLLSVNTMDHPDLKYEQQFFPYAITDDGKGNVAIEVRYEYKKTTLSPAQITAAMLTQLKATAERGLRTTVTDVVISVPPMWDEVARRNLLSASKMAGMNVLRLMSESLAVAVTYGLLRPLPTEVIRVCFVDVGASHTNAAVVAFTDGKLKVLGVASDHKFGGRQFDQLLFENLVAEIKTKYKMDISTNPKSCLKLRKAVTRLKHRLSANRVVNWNVEYIMNDRDVSGQMSREAFETMAAPYMGSLTAVIQAALERSNTTMEQLHSMEVIGGGTRIPIVSKTLQDIFGRSVSRTCDSDESVAKGCALQCAMLSPIMRVKAFNVIDCQPYNVIAEWGLLTGSQLEARPEPLFRAMSTTPHFTIVVFEDVKASFQVVTHYQDAKLKGTNRFVFSGFPATFQDEHPIVKVKFQLGPHGLIFVSRATLMELEPEVAEEVEAAPKEGEEPMDTTPDDAPAKEGAEAEAEPMDTTPDEAPAKAADAKEAKEKKKQYKRTELTVTSQTCGMSVETENAGAEREASMSNQDRIVHETSEARNTLESYVYEMRGRVESSSDLGPYGKDAEKTRFLEALMVEDDWLASDEGFEGTKSQYKGKLEALNKMGGCFISRKFEHEQRSSSVDIVKKMIKHYQTFADSKDEKYSHITEAQRDQVRAKCTEVDSFIITELAKQDRLAMNDDPVLTKAILQSKAKELDAVCKPIANTPKPPPEPEPEPAKAEEPAPAKEGEATTEAPAAEATTQESMDQAD